MYQDQIIDLIYEIQAEFNLPVTIENQFDLLQISQFYQTQSGNFWIALINSRIIGTIALVDIGNHQATLRKMFVDKAYRGKETQTAQSLLGTLFSWCKQKNIHEVYLGTQSIFLAAHRFYEKNGFVEIPKVLLPKTFPVNPIDSKFYIYRFC